MGFNKSHPNEQAYKGKLVLRIIALVLVTAALVATAYSWRLSRFILPIVILSWIWHFTNIIKRVTSEYPIHPGANVACDLILWILFINLGGFNLILSTYARYINATTWSQNNLFTNQMGNGVVLQSAVVSTDEDGEVTRTYQPTVDGSVIDNMRAMGQASLIGIGFAMIVALLHFVLFIWACVDTHRYRRERRTAVDAFRAKQHEFSTEQE